MDKRLRIAGITAAVIMSIVILLSPSSSIPIPEPSTRLSAGSEAVIVLATNLDEPRSIAIHDSYIFVAEKSGAIRLIDNGNLLDEPIITLRAAKAHDGGLVSIITHPNFDDNQMLYAYMTYNDSGKLWNKIMWIHYDSKRATDAGILLDKIPASDFSNGGAMVFGPDGKLYVGTGATSETSRLPQDLESLAGKILRINDDGSTPEDNPTRDSLVYAIGFHDPQGMDWDLEGRLIVADAGSTKNDELDIVNVGQNYGWPDEQCSGPEHVSAIMCFDPGLGLGGIAIYLGDSLAPNGSVIVASLRTSGIYSIELDSKTQTTILVGLGRIRDVATTQDGTIYAITSNTDNRGFANLDDDRLLHVVR